jgi:hypothetical protein
MEVVLPLRKQQVVAQEQLKVQLPAAPKPAPATLPFWPALNSDHENLSLPLRNWRAPW